MFDGSSNIQQELIGECDQMTDHLENLIAPLQIAAEGQKIINLFKDQTITIVQDIDLLKSKPTDKNCENLNHNMNNIVECLNVLLSMEEDSELKVRKSWIYN